LAVKRVLTTQHVELPNPSLLLDCSHYSFVVVSRSVTWRMVLGWLGLLAIAVGVLVAAVYLVFWPVSDLIATHDVAGMTGLQRAAALQAARGAAQSHLLTFGAGVFAAGALAYTARNFALSRRTFELTEQGQVTGRYTEAVEQLGSDKLDVRIGGIYALERVARDSLRDSFTVMQVLATFICVHSHEPWRSAGISTFAKRSHSRAMRPDIQAALTVIARRSTNREAPRIMLNGANLTSAILHEGDLRYADLTKANLTRANLNKSNFTDAYLVEATLQNAYLNNAILTGALLMYADLTKAELRGADLTNAGLWDADFTGADLARADLSTAGLTAAVIDRIGFHDAIFTDADLTDARWPQDVPVPTGWLLNTDSGTLRRFETDSDRGCRDEFAPSS
jgi:hypothetical protein